MQIQTSKVWSVIALILGHSITLDLYAAHDARATPISEVQLYGHMRIDTPDVVWLKLPGGWSGTTCAADWVWFAGKENPAFVATALTARATNATLTVVVDDSYPKLSGYCQVITVAL